MDREKIIEAFDEAKELVWTDDDEYTIGYNRGLEAGKEIAIALLEEQEAVVRCKDCKHYNIIGCSEGFGWCERYNIGHTDNWFCADGERKEGR